MNPPRNARCEIKFVTLDAHYHDLLSWLSLHPASFRRAYPPRIVRNVYFDTHGYDAYVDNAAGASRRTKVRFRWYGESNSPNRGRLEIKCKRNHVVWKVSYDVEAMPDLERSDWSTITRGLRRALPPEGRRWLQENPQPVLINRYRREYFVAWDGRVRATLDGRQRVYDQRYKPWPNTSREANLPRTAVLEIKCPGEDRERAVRILRTVPLRMSRNSKYVIGMKAMHGY